MTMTDSPVALPRTIDCCSVLAIILTGSLVTGKCLCQWLRSLPPPVCAILRIGRVLGPGAPSGGTPSPSRGASSMSLSRICLRRGRRLRESYAMMPKGTMKKGPTRLPTNMATIGNPLQISTMLRIAAASPPNTNKPKAHLTMVRTWKSPLIQGNAAVYVAPSTTRSC